MIIIISIMMGIIMMKYKHLFTAEVIIVVQHFLYQMTIKIKNDPRNDENNEL